MAILLTALLASVNETAHALVEAEYIYYSDFGAKGDGVTDDFDAIALTHNYANKNNLPVRADADAVYYIGATTSANGAIIKTDTHWGNARFIIDDRSFVVESGSQSPHRFPIFTIEPNHEPINLLEKTNITAIAKNQKNLNLNGFTPNFDMLVAIRDSSTVQRKNFGEATPWGGPSQKQDIIRIDKHGNIDPSTPVIWNFLNITELTAIPIDAQTLTLTGGHFDRRAHLNSFSHSYISRGIVIHRSNVHIDGFRHTVDDSGVIFNTLFERNPEIASYAGTIITSRVADVSIANTYLTGHRTAPNSVGSSYDILLQASVNVTLKNVHQLNSIIDNRFWGIMGGNDIKNITFDNVSFSRFDTHRQVHNVTIKNSEIGWAGILVTGGGLLHVENTIVRHGSRFIEFREDWGSTWEGGVKIINCAWEPLAGEGELSLLHIVNDGFDFGFNTFMPSKITIDGLVVLGNRPLRLINPFDHRMATFVLTEELTVKNLNRPLTVPHFMKRNLTVAGDEDSVNFSANTALIAGLASSGGFVLICVAVAAVAILRKRKKI
jgi:hypothetical protein